VLVLTATALLISTPLRMMRTSLRELLEAAPDPSVIEPVAARGGRVRREFGLPEPAMRIGKLGRKLYIELDFVVEPGAWDVGDADVVRRTLVDRLAQPGRLLWVNVELHTDPEWDH
jgi:predicted Co/Zn/Cd cation transporter (cation efflux family)